MSAVLPSINVILAQGWIYLFLYAALAAAMIVELFYENEVVSRWLARTGILVLILFVGLRWQTGTDWDAYFRIFYTNDTSADYDTAVFGIDYGYLLLNQLVYSFTNNYTIFLLINTAITFLCVYIFLEKSTKFPCMGVYLLYTGYVVTHFVGSNRRMLAIGLVCLALTALRKEGRLIDNWGKWAIPFGLASAIHRTSVAALPCLVIGRRAWPTWVVVLGLLFSLGLGLLGLPFGALESLAGLLTEYTGFTTINKLVFYTSGDVQLDANYDVTRQAILGIAKRSTVLVIFIAYMHRQAASEYTHRLFNIYIVGCFIYFMMIGAPIFQIISTYYSIVEIALLPIILHNLPSLKIPYTFYLLGVPFLLLLSSLIPYLDQYVPYLSIFSIY